MQKVYIDNINDYILIDDEDYNTVNKYKWHINENYGTTRALAFINGRKVALPYFITGVENSYQKVKNLDFTRNNIGIDENKYRYRKPQRNASSQYKGVRLMKSKSGKHLWISTISVDNERIHLGSYQTEKEAAKAYNEAVFEYWGGNGYINDI
ncbi:TPA: AP2 domain-containing protein [Staphylococcus aureus]|jgi:hypothetical protein|nr:AP2 domain-containing protein [Staphylococcus aureus]HEP1288754.1 AP2 domain-containing protein [Staphylococcus aureus]